MATKPRKLYTGEFKKKAVELATQNGFSKTAKSLSVATSALYKWQRELGINPPANAKPKVEPTPRELSQRPSNITAGEEQSLREKVKWLERRCVFMSKLVQLYERESFGIHDASAV